MSLLRRRVRPRLPRAVTLTAAAPTALTVAAPTALTVAIPAALTVAILPMTILISTILMTLLIPMT